MAHLDNQLEQALEQLLDGKAAYVCDTKISPSDIFEDMEDEQLQKLAKRVFAGDQEGALDLINDLFIILATEKIIKAQKP